MKSSKPWHNLWLIVLATIILPPLGLFMLWKSPRTLRAKITVCAVLMVIWTGAAVGALTTDLYGLLSEPEEPLFGYDVDMDSRNRYRNPTIYPLEREVFGKVVRELRMQPPTYSRDEGDAQGPRVASPEQQAFEIVAGQYDALTVDDVAAIYRKVSSQISAQKKK